MDWLLLELIVLAILVNIRAFIAWSQFKQQKEQLSEDTEAIQHGMEQFVASLENENEELYHKLVDYVKTKEAKLEERIRQLEDRLDGEADGTASETALVQQAEERPENIGRTAGGRSETEKIAQLYKQGFSPKQIARFVQADQGEIELVINMHKKKTKLSLVK